MDQQNPLGDQTGSVRTIRISQGLFLLRYVSSKAGLNAPTVSVMMPPGAGIDVIAPGDEGPQLVSPGDGLVVRAARDSLINLKVTPSYRNGSCDAELVLERVSTSIRQTSIHQASIHQAVALQAPEDFSQRGAVLSADDIEVLAHVSRRGDVIVPAGEWICGPQLPMAIEGLEIRWKNRPRGVDIVSRATVNARGLKTLAEQSIGSFLGTRGRAAPITTLTLGLVGTSAQDFSLSCDALFLGQQVTSISGKSCILSGPTGREPLVGLRLSVVAAVDRAAQHSLAFLRAKPAEAVHPAPPRPSPPQTDRSGRVRIFRSPRGRSAPAFAFSK